MSAKVVDAADVAAPFVAELKQKIAALKGPVPVLVGFLANDDKAARKYAEWTAKTCAATGVRFELRECQRTELEDKIIEANEDDNVHGIMVYYPVFNGSQDQYIQNTVSYKKDVEGLCHKYVYNMYHNIRFLDEAQTQKCIIPCTPLAILKILEYVGVYNPILPYGRRLHGRVITVINRSEHVGRPLAALLANDGAKVYSVDENGTMEFHRGEGLKFEKHVEVESATTLTEALPQSDVVITGVPARSYRVPTSQLKEGVIAINFSGSKNFEEEELKQKASIFVPSVGKVTVAMLERNLMRLHEYLEKDKEARSSNSGKETSA
ncbi:hypothetical protein HK097_005340 [Rhizophlyctis rosea]|uniref:Methylenetetrahydrofolate dehydrogenase n=1 Tax=Rhizophlyctis rosea TaxID=64517 RepID=A0AAD5SJ90_9FUNG|nr:hypothetical protein HK097_005340 [Rhizophlyctis rosea]